MSRSNAKRAQPTKPAKPPAYKIESWPTKRLKPYERNARTHPDKQIDQLRASLRQYGQVWPILVRKDGTIIAGHGRLEAAKAEGLKEIRVIVANGWTEEQCRAFGLLDNKVALNSAWDQDLLSAELLGLKELGADLGLLAFSDKELAKLLPAADGAGETPTLDSQYQILIECKDEAHQVELLKRLEKDGIECRALIA